jgi:hypothetical protein
LDGEPREPWKLTYVIYMVDIKTTGALYTYAHDTFGAMLAFNNLEEQIAIMRMLRGEHVFPIVHLERRPMKTNFGMKTRPHLQIMDWRATRGGGFGLVSPSPAPQLPGPATAAAPAPTATPPVAPSTATPPTTTLPTAAPPTAAPPTAAPPTASSASAVLDATKPVKPVTVAELIADELPPWA